MKKETRRKGSFFARLDRAEHNARMRRFAGTPHIYNQQDMLVMFGPYLKDGITNGLSVREIKLINTVQYLRNEKEQGK